MFVFEPVGGNSQKCQVFCRLVKKRKDCKKGPPMWWAVLYGHYKQEVKKCGVGLSIVLDVQHCR